MASIVAAELIGRLLQQDAGYYLPVFVAAGLLYPAARGLSRAQPEDGSRGDAILKTIRPSRLTALAPPPTRCAPACRLGAR